MVTSSSSSPFLQTSFIQREKLIHSFEKREKTKKRCLLTSLLVVFLMVTLVVILLIVVASTHSLSKTQWKWPRPSESVMESFHKFAITTDHTICANIGKEIIASGGNAADAAIAAMFCLGATNPQSSGIGGGFLMTLYNKTTGKCVAIDAREAAPLAADVSMFVGDPDGSKYGFRAVGVPGELAGYWLVYQRFGSGRLPWAELVRPTIRLLRSGVPVSRYLEEVMKVKERHFRLFPSMKAWLNPSTNDTYKTGDRLPRTKLVRTLEKIALSSDPAELFYRGDFAEIIHKEMAANGGIITKEDLARYKVRVYETALSNDHFRDDLVICGGPPPSGFAVTQLIINTISQLYPNASIEALRSDPKVYHHQIEAQKFAYAQRTLLGDPDFVPSADELAKKLMTKKFAEEVLRKVRESAQPSEYYGGDGSMQKPDHGTSHVSVLDAEGNGVAATTTINRWFGAAVESDELGILYNDEMDDFSTPGQNNGFGFAPSPTNFIAPEKRPMSSMSPLVIYDKNTKEIKMVAGASGGSKIISALSKAIIRSLIFGESIKKAIDSPMLHNQFTPDITQITDDFPLELKAILETKYGQKFRNTTGFEGIMQGIEVKEGVIRACGDFRRKTDQRPAGI